MINRRPTETRELSFDQATEYLKGYPCFSHIPLEFIHEAVQIAAKEGKTLQVVRGRIAQVIWQDEVDNRLSHLSYLEQKEVAVSIRGAVDELVERFWPTRPSAELRLVQ